jgi:hypothetical protein
MEEGMAYSTFGRGLALVSALAVGVAFTAPAAKADWHHHGGISTGAAVGIGLGSFALGTALGSAAAYPYYGGGYYGGGYYGGYPYGGYAGYGYGYPSYGYSGYAPAYGGYYGSSYAPYYGAGWGY